MKLIIKCIGFCFSVIILAYGIHDILYNVEENGCGMTWMYENPEYIKISLPNNVEKKFTKYSLFVYGEGTYAKYLKQMGSDVRLSGIPVVFVHGNAGRYKQVRSPGSVSLRKSERFRYHFNYFSVDYDEELSALYGPFLGRQTEFLHHSIERILSCYRQLGANQPTSVIAIGHSMGGLVIRGLFASPTFNPKTVQLVITLATPHTQPPIKLEKSIDSYYTKVNRFWSNHSLSTLENITVLSIGGGFRDILVRSDLCHLQSDNKYHMNHLTSSIPGIWLSTDHQCIVWCNELVRKLTKSFFQMIDAKNGQITQNPSLRYNVLSKLFYQNNIEFKIFKSCKSVDIKSDVYKYESKENRCIKINLSVTLSNQIFVWGILHHIGWVYLCPTNNSECIPVHTTHVDANNQFTLLNLKQLDGFNIVLKLHTNDIVHIQTTPPINLMTSEQTTLSGEYERVPSSESNLLTSELRFSSLNHVIDINLPQITETWQTFQIHLKSLENSSNKLKVIAYVPWSREIIIRELSSHENILLRFYHQRPIDNNDSIKLILLSKQKNIQMSVKLIFNITSSIGQLLRFNFEKLISMILIYTLIYGFARHGPTTIFLYFLLLLFLLFMKISYLQLNNKMDLTVALNRYIYPEFIMAVLALSIAPMIYLITNLLVVFVPILFYPITKVFTLVTRFSSTAWLYCGCIPLVGLCYMIPENIPMVILLQLIFHSTLINNISDQDIKSKQRELLASFLPIVIMSIIMPLIVYTKDVVENHRYLVLGYQGIESFRDLHDMWQVNYSANVMLLTFSFIYNFYLFSRFPKMSFKLPTIIVTLIFIVLVLLCTFDILNMYYFLYFITLILLII